MKKNIYLILLPICFIISAKAQKYQYTHFPSSNAVWSEYYWGTSNPAVNNKYALFDEDTVINGIKYSKLFYVENQKEITLENATCIGGIREDTLKRVFASSSVFPHGGVQRETLLFDFSLLVGDTTEAFTGGAYYTNFPRWIVDDIDTVLFGGTMRKVFHFRDVISPIHVYIQWIEGVGSSLGLLLSDLPSCLNSELICMHHNDTLVYFNDVYSGCTPAFVLDNTAQLPNSGIKVYPNPVVKGTLINFNNLNFNKIEIYDITGAVVFKDKLNGVKNYILSTDGFSAGSYTYRLSKKGAMPTHGKIVVR